jgi:hypothetical protein
MTLLRNNNKSFVDHITGFDNLLGRVRLVAQ